MVTIVLLVIWVCGTVPVHKQSKINDICVRITAHTAVDFLVLWSNRTNYYGELYNVNKAIPIVVVDGTVLVATIGATVAAGVTVLKMGFCEVEME